MSIGNDAMKLTYGDDVTGAASGTDISIPDGFTSLYIIRRSGSGNVTIKCVTPAGTQQWTLRNANEHQEWLSDGKGGIYKGLTITVPSGVLITYSYQR